MPRTTVTHHAECSAHDEELWSQPLMADNTHRSSGRYDNLDSGNTSPTNRFRPMPIDERTSLLHGDSQQSDYLSASIRPSYEQSRHKYSQTLRSRTASRRGSVSRRPDLSASYLSVDGPDTAHRSIFNDNKIFYDNCTSTDWVRDHIADAARVKELRSRRDWRGRLQARFDGAQGWILVAIIGCLTALFAFVIDVSEATIFDYKTGFCKVSWWHNKRRCCHGASICEDWTRWSSVLGADGDAAEAWDYVFYCLWVIFLAMLACLATLATKTTISSHVTLPTLDEHLGANDHHKEESPHHIRHAAIIKPIKTYYPAAGSGIAETKVICSGFVLRGYLGLKTLLWKTVSLIFSVSSGLVVGREGPLIHIGACIGNVASRIFSKYEGNSAKKREILSASCAAGIAVAFGAPIGGVLYSLEEIAYFYPLKVHFRTFFACITAALCLKFLNPYGTHKIVPFEVRYFTDWRGFEIIIVAFLGVIGGVLGALFIKASRIWAKTFRRTKLIKDSPLTEVFLVALVTGLLSYSNRYTRLPVAELLFEVATPCDSFSGTGTSLCPTRERIPEVIKVLAWAFVVKALLTLLAFGIRTAGGIFVPSMVCAGLLGRIVGHALQYVLLEYPWVAEKVGCPTDGHPESCIVPGVYALAAAGATLCGVTRLSLSLVIILFEVSSREHILPFSISVLIAKWVSDWIEPQSIYDLLMDPYPYLDSNVRPAFSTELADITPAPGQNCIDISESSWIPAAELRQKLQHLQLAGDQDGSFPIIQHGLLKGLIPAPELEYALDSSIEHEATAWCYMNPHEARVPSEEPRQSPRRNVDHLDEQDQTSHGEATASNGSASDQELVDLTQFIDVAPVALDVCSPMELVHEFFVKLGLGYVCCLREGRFAGIVYKKAFVKYVKEVERQHKGTTL